MKMLGSDSMYESVATVTVDALVANPKGKMIFPIAAPLLPRSRFVVPQ
jgi:hypothetical protein